MSNGKKQSGNQVIWTYEYAQWQKRVEKLWKIRARLSQRATGHGSEIDFYLEVFSLVDDKPFTRLVRVSFRYPSSTIASLDTQVLALLSEAEARTEEAVKVMRDQINML